MKGKPPLSKNHKSKRFEFALEHIKWKEEWKNVIFSDEKKFNLDGPDGYHYYWHDKRVKEINYSKRVQGGGSIMIWIGLSYKSLTPVYFISTKMNSVKYTVLLQRALVPFSRSIYNENFIFQHDNAPCHRARNTKNWLEENNINTLEWPARSPDLNPVENLFGIICKDVYKNGKQFQKVNDLKNAIISSVEKIPKETLENLINSMQKRLTEVLKNFGASIKY